jgi:hypothetical protein
MAIDLESFAVEQIRRVLLSMGWKVIATDSTGPKIRITVEKEKAAILEKK